MAASERANNPIVVERFMKHLLPGKCVSSSRCGVDGSRHARAPSLLSAGSPCFSAQLLDTSFRTQHDGMVTRAALRRLAPAEEERQRSLLRMTLDIASLSLLRDALMRLDHGFDGMPHFDATPTAGDLERMRVVMLEVADRMRDNFPYPHPMYAGQMLEPPHAIARLAYALAQHVNPNNHALDGGRASSAMEKEAVAQIAAMCGWKTFLGHLTSGGTVANLEALWIAGRLRPGKTILVSAQGHYTHKRISEVLGLACETVPVDDRARMDVAALESRLARGGVGTIVVTLGTTAVGSVDPLPRVLELQQRHGFRIHADAAYGGYFGLASNLDEPARAAFDALPAVDSVAIDPHKHGLQPYGCGCILFRDPAVGALYRHDS